MIQISEQIMDPPTSHVPGEQRRGNGENAADKKSAEAQVVEDVALAARVQCGDEEAARELVRDLYPTVIRLVRSHLPKRMSEEDLAQTVYLKVFSKLHQFSGRVPLKHWVSRIAVNTCFNALRSERIRTELRMSDLSEEQNAVIQQLAMSTEELPGCRSQSARELVHTILAMLKPEERLVISLLHLEEWTVEEIGRKTGWSISRVKVKAFRARQKMRKHLKVLLEDHREEDSLFSGSASLWQEAACWA